MSGPLATRCPACSTVFRVVPDQLRVSEGWVRCGRCSNVFDATLSLVDLDSGAPRTLDGMPRRREAPPSFAAPEPAPAPVPQAGETVAGRPAAEPVADLAHRAAAVAGTDAATDVDAAAQTATTATSAAAAATATVTPPAPIDPPPTPPTDPAAAVEPSFVRRAQRAERWRQPRVRAALATASLAAVGVLAAQIAITYRDLVAARYPAARPALEQACGWLGCRVEAARAIDGLAVDSSGLLRIERSDLYRLSVALRNLAGIEVALPALDLALTDTRGRLIARRVLQPSDLGAPAPTLAAGGELALQATLRAELPDPEPVAGYTIELFYP